MGWKSLPRFPYEPEQSHGAYLGLCIFALWMSQHHPKEVIRQIINPTASLDQKGLSYSVAIGGLVIGIIFIVLFCLQVQMSVNIIAPFFAIWFTIGIAITCLRAELGSPVHDLNFIGPDEILPSILGVRHIGTPNLVGFSYLYVLKSSTLFTLYAASIGGIQNC